MKKEKIFDSLLYILIFFTILSIIIVKPINDLDEIWNFNFARNTSNGLVPYRDFNMIITPGLSLICGIILKIIGNELIVMRLLAGLLCTFVIYITYRLFSILNIKKELSIIFTFFIGYLFYDCFCIDYNFATLLLVLFIIYKEIKLYKKDNIFIKQYRKTDIFLGVLAGLTITMKQTSGLIICIVLLGNKLLFVRNKEEFRKYIGSFCYRLIGVMIPILVLFIYLVVNNAFYDFISYTIKGITDFSNYISYRGLIKLDIIGVLAIIVPVAIIYAWCKSIIKEKDKKLYILLVYGMSIFVLAFPISNKIHFLIGALPIIILIFYEIYNVLYKLYKNKVKYKRIVICILIFFSTFTLLFTLYYGIKNMYEYFVNRENFSTLNSFKYITMSKDLENSIKKVEDYILSSEEKVLILDSSAAIYMIPIDRYNKDYDMFNKGNFGENGEKRLIKDIEKSENIKYLVLNNNYKKNWQTPTEVISYVQKNKTKIGQIEIFDVYQ